MKRLFVLTGCLLLFGSVSAFAQDEGRAFGVEFTSTFWMLGPRGAIQAGGRPVDLGSDLGVVERRMNDLMRVAFKFGETHRVVLEEASYQFQGSHDVSVPFRFSGNDFSLRDTVYSKPTVRYVFAGYARDVLSRQYDHLSLEVGASYLRGTGFVQSLRTGVSASRTRTVPMPVVGLGYTHNLKGAAERFEITGDISGMSVGDTGHYARGSVKVGARVWSHLVVFGGYGFLNLGTKKDLDKVDLRFRGPLFSLQFRDR
jgi:hypothetical protein